MDVSQWIADPEAITSAASAHETQTVNMADTDAIQLSTSKTMADEEPAAADKSKLEKRVPGKLPPRGNASKDSQEAAAAMLSKLRKRR